MSDAESAPPLNGGKTRRPRAKVVLVLLALAAVAAALAWIVNYEVRGKYLQATDDAQTNADAVTIAPRINGYVDEILVADNQEVAAGQPLVHIDARSYGAQAAQAQAQILVAQAGAANGRAGVREQYATIVQNQAQLAAALAKAAYDASEVARYTSLASAGAETTEKLAQLRVAAAQSGEDARAQAATLEAQRRRVASLESQVRQNEAQAQAARAQLANADVDVRAALIRAPIAGRVGDKTVALGDYAQPGTRLMSIVPLERSYVVANFKETQIGLMRPGQPATIKVDALAGAELHGRVASIAPGTGAQFSLLPPQNATGNFTKIVQRVPVRVAVEAGPGLRKLLVAGLSVTVTVDTISAKGQTKQIEREQERLASAGPGP